MSGYTAATTTVSVSAATAATYDAAGYGALTWTDSNEIISVGEQGADTEVVKYNLLHDNSTNKRLGSTDEGQQTFEGIFDTANGAQVIMEAGRSGRTPVSFKVAYSDGDTVYYEGYVTSLKRASGGSSDLIKLNVTVEIDGGTVVTD